MEVINETTEELKRRMDKEETLTGVFSVLVESSALVWPDLTVELRSQLIGLAEAVREKMASREEMPLLVVYTLGVLNFLKANTDMSFLFGLLMGEHLILSGGIK